MRRRVTGPPSPKPSASAGWPGRGQALCRGGGGSAALSPASLATTGDLLLDARAGLFPRQAGNTRDRCLSAAFHFGNPGLTVAGFDGVVAQDLGEPQHPPGERVSLLRNVVVHVVVRTGFRCLLDSMVEAH